MRFRGLSTVALLTLVSRILGLLRDAGMAVLFGAGPLLDTFSLAFRLPNLARRLFGEGALSAAFLPVFMRTMNTDADQGRRVAWATISLLAGILGIGVVLVESVALLAMPYASPEFRGLIELIAWLFPYVLFICVAAQFSAVLHGRDHFFWPAALPVLLNVIWIAAIVTAPQLFDQPMDQMRWISASILIAGLWQCAIGWWAISARGVPLRWDDLATDREATRGALSAILATMLPTLAGLTITQVNVVADSMLAWVLSPSAGLGEQWEFVAAGTATALYLGQRLYQFPLGVFGVALGTVLFPVLTRHAQAGQTDLLGRDLTRGLQIAFAIGVPASLGLILLSEEIPRVLFEYGEFDASDSAQTGRMITAYGCGVWAAVGLLIVNRAFFALSDTRTPIRAGLLAVVVNLILDVVLLLAAGGVGLALATSFATMLQLAFSMRLLGAAVPSIDRASLWSTAVKTAIATIIMTAAIEAASYALGQGSHRVIALVVPMAAGIGAYIATARIIGLEAVNWLFRKPDRHDDGEMV